MPSPDPQGPLAELGERLERFRLEVQSTDSEQSLRELQARYVGRKGVITELEKWLGTLAKEERPAFGKELNRVKREIESEVDKRLGEIETRARARDLERRLDVTLPGRRRRLGRYHPVTLVWRDLVEIFAGLGFSLAEGPEIDTDWNNFEALNIPQHHPARQMQDTFYLDGAGEGGAERDRPAVDLLLRTHTSPVQIRTMRRQPPPVKIIAPGRVYRRDDDPTHSPMFFQIEGLYVDTEPVTMTHLKGTILHFVQRFFQGGAAPSPLDERSSSRVPPAARPAGGLRGGGAAQVRFRPSYFPFVEPGAEMDMSCTQCGGTGVRPGGVPCRVCKQSGWLEIGGAGMVHPTVLANVGYDPEQVTGFAFGMGLDRMAMLRYGISDIKLLYESDVRFLGQF